MCANYISKDTFEEVKHRIPPENIIKKKNRIKLADNATVLQSNKAVILKLIISDDLGNTTTYSGEFVVIDMKYKELIVGFPAITTDLWSFFTSALETRRSLSSAPQHVQLKSGQVYSVSNADTLFYPWQQGDLSIEAPEDRDTPHPAQFSEYQAFLGKTREEALSEFLSLFDEHIDPEFRKVTPIDRLLREKGVLLFVPKEWEGISGIPPLKLKFKEGLPHRMKPKARPLSPKLYEPAEIEFTRLRGYMYVPSRSPWASCLVIAPKATKPFIRFCGDYIWINRFIETGHFYIPIVRHELEKIINYPIFIDIDMTNAYHQIPLDEDTSEKLSIQTPWGQFRPKYMPEGIGPGSSVLQETVRTIFEDFDWIITIFDNLLILATDYEDAYRKLDVFLRSSPSS